MSVGYIMDGDQWKVKQIIASPKYTPVEWKKHSYCGVPLWIVSIFRNNPLIILCFIGVINYAPPFPCAHRLT